MSYYLQLHGYRHELSLEVAHFALAMQRRLVHKNVHEELSMVGWKQTKIEDLQAELASNAFMLNNAVKVGDSKEIRKKAPDVGNYAMMIADVQRVLRT